MNRKIAIFGASSGGIKVAQTLKSFGVDFCCFLDNDKKKWGMKAGSIAKEICSPNILLEDNYQIIIASEHQAEIEEQLKNMGQFSHLILKEEIIFPCVERMFGKFDKENVEKSSIDKRRKIIIDLAEGAQLGGIETWTYTVARELLKLGIDVEVFAKKTNMQPPEEIGSCFTYFDIEYYNFNKNVYDLAKEIIKRSPCTVIVNKHTQILYAAYLAKKLCTAERVKIVSVIHSDLITLYRRQEYLENIVDEIICVSKRIKENLINFFGVDERKVSYKESPVYFEKELSRTYTLDAKQPIQIGYAGRLEKMLKRADNLMLCIQKLEEMSCNYVLTIAGEGSYKKNIQQYVSDNALSKKVFLTGQIPKEKMTDFWKGLDIYISVSDVEGSSISLLEAMSNGVIPIVTAVSGTDEFIQEGKNGYLVEQGDIGKIALYIRNIEKKRSLLQDMGECARKIIVERCNPREYGRYILEISGIEI